MLVSTIFFLAALVFTVTGFGLALVSMPLLVTVLGIEVATPLVALVALTIEIVMLVRYRRSLDFRSVARLSTASLVAIPLGAFALRRLPDDFLSTTLGTILVGYGLYGLTTPRLPELAHGGWAYAFGFAAGLLSGAMNASGPPAVIYGTCRRWDPRQFRSNLQAFFFVNSFVTIPMHALAGNFTPSVWRSYLAAVPGMLLGVLAGVSLDARLDPSRFRKVVLGLLVLLGSSLLV